MDRRLYFLLPDRTHALSVVEDLSRVGIKPECIHALADKRTRMDGLPPASPRQESDTSGKLEKALWNSNLISFALAFGCFIYLLITGHFNGWLLLPTSVMAVNFITGLKFSNLPNTHLGEFRDALAHGEILLLVDVPESRVSEIEHCVHHHHPEAATGGVGWGAHAFGL